VAVVVSSSTEVGAAATERVADELREQILAGALSPGSPLREVALTEELGVSRNTLREALRLLTNDGLVVQQLYRGATVKTLSQNEIRDIYQVRRTLELRAVEESTRASDAALSRMEDTVSATERAAAARDWRAVGTGSLRFHRAVVGLLDSPMLDAFFRRVTAQLRLSFAVAVDEADFQRPWVRRDREICDLLHAGLLAAAGRALRQYLDDSERIVGGLVDASNGRQATPAPERPTVAQRRRKPRGANAR
jgi:DNA-binding GntR family transcriptional regulator